jgi:hypothetical protein
MRKVLRRGAIFATGMMLVFLMASLYASRYPNSAIGQLTQVVVHIGKHYVLRLPDAAEQAALDDGYSANDETLAAPEDPQPVAIEPNAPSSSIVSKRPTPSLPRADESDEKLPVNGTMENEYRIMPPCQDETEELPTFMPYAVEKNDFIQRSISLKPAAAGRRTLEEEPAKEPGQLPGPNKLREIIEGHAKEIYSPGARERGRKFGPRIDTLDFRPSDADPEEMGPIEF